MFCVDDGAMRPVISDFTGFPIEAAPSLPNCLTKMFGRGLRAEEGEVEVTEAPGSDAGAEGVTTSTLAICAGGDNADLEEEEAKDNASKLL